MTQYHALFYPILAYCVIIMRVSCTFCRSGAHNTNLHHYTHQIVHNPCPLGYHLCRICVSEVYRACMIHYFVYDSISCTVLSHSCVLCHYHACFLHYILHYYNTFALQDGAKSWAILKRWDALLQGPALEEDVFTNLRPSIIKDLEKNYHQENTDNSAQRLPTGDYEDYDFFGFQSLFISIQRRASVGLIRETTEVNCERVREEFLRVDWPKNKPPEVSSWYLCVPLPACACVLCARFTCVG
jgi:hypothetical protein